GAVGDLVPRPRLVAPHQAGPVGEALGERLVDGDEIELHAGQSVIVTDSMTTGSTGRSPGPVGVAAMASTTARLSASATSPKIVWRFWRCGVGPTVMKNWEPLVPGPALAIASL